MEYVINLKINIDGIVFTRKGHTLHYPDKKMLIHSKCDIVISEVLHQYNQKFDDEYFYSQEMGFGWCTNRIEWELGNGNNVEADTPMWTRWNHIIFVWKADDLSNL